MRTDHAPGGATGELQDKRIAHVITESMPFGGAQRNTLLTVEGLVRDGYAAELICGPGGPLIGAARKAGVPVHVIPDLVRPVAPLRDWRTLRRLRQLFRSRAYHIVHTHSTKAGFLGRLAAWWTGVPVIVHTVHGVPFTIDKTVKSRCYLALERLFGAISHRLVCVGEVLRQEMMAWKVAPEEKLTTVYSGIDFSAYVQHCPASVMKQRLGLENAWPIIGCVGRLSQQKAQDDLIAAVGHLTIQYPKLALLVVGEGELRPRLEQEIERQRLSPHVYLLGERTDIADLLNIVDVYAMSSRWEGVGRALTEAMYCGLPVVATSVNGVVELVVHEETGLLVPPGDVRALAAAIDRVASDRVLARRLGANARQKAKALMDSQHMVHAIEDLYQQLTG